MYLFSLSLILFLSISTIQGSSEWSVRKVTHRAQQLSNSQLRYLTSLNSAKSFNRTVDPILIPRVVGTGGHDQVKNYLIRTMKNLGWYVEKDHFTDTTPLGVKPFTNVIATLKPDADRQLVLACHYDSKYMGRKAFIGATDSAVPCAMMIDIATSMHKELVKLNASETDLSLQFIFFDGEEAFRRWTNTDSIYGARNLAAVMERLPYPDYDSPTNSLDRIDLMVLLDLIGERNPTFSNYLDSSSGRWFQRMAEIEYRLYQLGLIRKLAGMQPYFTNGHPYAQLADDHLPFYHRGVPVLHVIAYPFPSVWHKTSDNRDIIHFPTVLDLLAIVRVFVAEYLNLQV